MSVDAPAAPTYGERVFTPFAERRVANRGRPARRQRLAFALLLIAFFITIYLIQDILWPRARQPTDYVELLISFGQMFWLVPVPGAIFGIVGLLLYQPHDRRRPPPITRLVSYRIVSRGKNLEALGATIEAVRRAMAARPLFPYWIEVVTDQPTPDFGSDVRSIVVPADWESSTHAKYKARALHWALHHSELPDDGWIMHLDEESQMTPSGVEGLARAIDEEERSGKLRIGQGVILYHRDLDSQTMLTLADSIRTGDDVGRFRLQSVMGRSVFGMHGSFILVRNDVEREVGFDFGPWGSVTEDAYWAMRQMENGRRTRWIEGYVAEQATRSSADFLRQRRRWFIGLWLVARRAPVSLAARLTLSALLVCWSVSWVGTLYTYVNLFVGLETNPLIRLLGNISFAAFVTLYLVGLWINLADRRVPRRRWVVLTAAQFLLLPVFSGLEAASIVYAIVRPDMGFHVVKK